MRKPPRLGCGPNIFPVRFHNVQYISNPQPNWAQDDPSAPDYIKNKEIAEEVRPISVNGVEFLSEDRASGGVNFVAGENVTFQTDGNSIIISATAEGGGSGDEPGGECSCPEYIEGEGIDIVSNEEGQKVISLEPNSIDDEHIESVSISKITQEEGDTLILNGGSIDG